jgi:hypothetical protein
MHDMPSQQYAMPGPHASPSPGHEQYLESAQNPLLLPLKGMQQPVSQSALVEHSGRQPPKSGLSDWTQEPRQQSVGVSRSPPTHASPCFLQGVVQAAISAHIATPVS